MKLGLQVVLAILSIFPALGGGLRMLFGAGSFLSGQEIPADLDSQLRFQSAYYFGLAVLLWWMIPNVERHTTLFRILMTVLFVGGLARAYSYITIGSPGPIMTAGMVIELCLPLLVIWQAKIAQKA